MGLFDRKNKKKERTITIQAISDVEGRKEAVLIESLLTGRTINITIPGTVNAYSNYESQVIETYRKYNGFSSFGNQQARAIVDLRTAFIAGEGISVSAEKDRTAKWIEKQFQKNNFNSINFIESVKGTELAGQSLFILKPKEWMDGQLYIKFIRVPYSIDHAYRPVYDDKLTKENIIDIQIKKDGVWVSAGFRNYLYVRTGGDDFSSYGAVTKTGVVLTDIENYDRAIKDMRRNNHIFARITPVFETASAGEANGLQAKLNDLKWKIGQAFIGSAKFKYETPSQGAHENLNSELVATVKTISSVTGVPVHWLGYVDLMSNRSTAETLYEMIKQHTVNERSIWESSLYDMIIKAQEMYIDSGGQEISNLDYNFEVKLPLIDFAGFLDRVKALNLAYTDEAISIDDYRNMLPGIDPYKTKRAIEKEKKSEKDNLMSMGLQLQQQENNLEQEGEQAI
jgi:hypothetical protein